MELREQSLNRTNFHIWHDSQQKGGFFDVSTLFETRSCTDLLHSLLVDIVLAHIV
jgi:hypothetical protein